MLLWAIGNREPMNVDIHSLAFIPGAVVTVYGALFLFDDRFFAFMQKHLWIGEEQDKRNWSREGINNFNRYGKGLGAFVGGLILLLVSVIYYLWH
jgi:hypothetical protein